MENDDLNAFERILISNDDKSAIISMILRKLKLWKSSEFWYKKID